MNGRNGGEFHIPFANYVSFNMLNNEKFTAFHQSQKQLLQGFVTLARNADFNVSTTRR